MSVKPAGIEEEAPVPSAQPAAKSPASAATRTKSTPPKAAGGTREGTDIRATVASALRHSAVVHRAQADRSSAEVDVKIAYGGYQPQLQSQAGFGTNDTYDYGITVAQPLYDWGRTGADVERAKAGLASAEASFMDVAEKAALEAVAAHIAVRRSEELVKAAQENLVAHQRFTELATDRTSGGVGDATEVELAGVHQGEAESALEDTKGGLRNAYSVYYSRVGREAARLAPVPELPLFLGEDRNLEAVALNAPAVLAARARQEAARHAAKVERAGLLPRLSAEAFVRGDDDADDAQTGVGLRIMGPSLAGLSNFSRVEAANLQADSARWASEAARREATLQARELFDHEPTLRGRIAILDTQLVRARALRDLYEDQFEIGERSVADLVNVQADVFRIERSLINARYDIIDLQYQAAAALGYLIDALQVNLKGREQ